MCNMYYYNMTEYNSNGIVSLNLLPIQGMLNCCLYFNFNSQDALDKKLTLTGDSLLRTTTNDLKHKKC